MASHVRERFPRPYAREGIENSRNAFAAASPRDSGELTLAPAWRIFGEEGRRSAINRALKEKIINPQNEGDVLSLYKVLSEFGDEGGEEEKTRRFTMAKVRPYLWFRREDDADC